MVGALHCIGAVLCTLRLRLSLSKDEQCILDLSSVALLLLLGVIQQLRGPNFTQFWPPTHLKWAIVEKCYIPRTICSRDQAFLLSTNLPHLSHVVIEWPPMYSSPSLSQSTYSVCLYSTSLVIMRISDIRMISQSEKYHAQTISTLQVDYQFLFN